MAERAAVALQQGLSGDLALTPAFTGTIQSKAGSCCCSKFPLLHPLAIPTLALHTQLANPRMEHIEKEHDQTKEHKVRAKKKLWFIEKTATLGSGEVPIPHTKAPRAGRAPQWVSTQRGGWPVPWTSPQAGASPRGWLQLWVVRASS